LRATPLSIAALATADETLHQARIERRGDDIVQPELVVLAIGGGHFLGHRLARQFGDRGGGGDLHFLVDRHGLHVERATEDVGEAQDVVDLVGIVRAARGDHAVRAHGLGRVGIDFGIGVGHREDDRLRRHLLDPVGLERVGRRQAQEDIRAVKRFLQRAGRGVDRVRALPLVHAVGAAAIDRARTIAHDHVVVAHAHGLDQLGAGNGGGARAVDHHLHFRDRAAGQVAGVEQAGGGDDRGAVLVIVHHRDLQALAQGLLDDEAFRGLDVFQIDPAKAGLHQGDRLDEGFRVFGGQFDIDRSTSAKRLNSTALPSITGLDASAPRLPRPRMAVPLEITATRLPLAV
jgi:hypothetical protein